MQYFVVVLAHSLRGRLRRFHVSHLAVYVTVAAALFGCFSLCGFVTGYPGKMWKAADYDALRREADQVRTPYQTLQKVVRTTNQQLASLEVSTTEMQVAYGIRRMLSGGRWPRRFQTASPITDTCLQLTSSGRAAAPPAIFWPSMQNNQACGRWMVA